MHPLMIGRFEQVAASMVVFAVEWAGRICCPYVQAAGQFNHLMIDSAVRWNLERALDGRPHGRQSTGPRPSPR